MVTGSYLEARFGKFSTVAPFALRLCFGLSHPGLKAVWAGFKKPLGAHTGFAGFLISKYTLVRRHSKGLKEPNTAELLKINQIRKISDLKISYQKPMLSKVQLHFIIMG